MSPTWGYNHRDVSLRIPVSSAKDCRIEHRVAGADANPYLVMAMVLAGIHHGIVHHCDPGPPVAEGASLPQTDIILPTRWDYALDAFRASEFIPQYLSDEYFNAFSKVRQAECDAYHAEVPSQDYVWYLRAV